LNMYHQARIDEQHNASETNDAQIRLKRHHAKIVVKATEADDHDVDCDRMSLSPVDSTIPVMAPFEDYKVRIQRLLNKIGMPDYEAKVIQYDHLRNNFVYALNSPRAVEQYILRVPARRIYSRNKTIENELALLNHLKGKLRVPRIKAYSLNPGNPLGKVYSVQTRIPGQSLNYLWPAMAEQDKYAIIDDVIRLLYSLETVTFPKAGELIAASPAAKATSNHYTKTAPPIVRTFTGPIAASNGARDRAGPNLKRFLTSSLKGRIQRESKHGPPDEESLPVAPRFKTLLAILNDLDAQGAFDAQPFPIVLHHWDLEPRNIIVSDVNPSSAWKITGLVDWDQAQALPRPLAREPRRWIWLFPKRVAIGDNDKFAGPPLSDVERKRRKYFFL
ncbi:MAG: hypothetical protein Q9228_007474, partial [Teloschistes exilis]